MEPEDITGWNGRPRGYRPVQTCKSNSKRRRDQQKFASIHSPEGRIQNRHSTENPTCYAHSQHLKLNIAKTQLISTTKSITPPAFSNSININTHLHVQAKTRDIILISSFPYFQFPVHRQTLSSIPSKHVILFQ